MNFAENPRKFQRIFYRKMRWKCWQKFWGISLNSFRGISHSSFRGISLNSFRQISLNSFRGISHNPFLGISRNTFQGFFLKFLLLQFWKITCENVDQICGGKFFRTNSWEFPGNYSQDFLKPTSGISWHNLIYSWVNSRTVRPNCSEYLNNYLDCPSNFLEV